MANVQQVQRVAADGITAVAFPNNSGSWLVKNYSSTDIYVSFEPTVAPETSIKIASGMGQVCVISTKYGEQGQPKTNTIYINGNGEVEVQQLWA